MARHRPLFQAHAPLNRLVLLFTLFAVLGAPGGRAFAEEQVLEAVLSEWKIQASRQRIQAGKIKFNAINRGKVFHELVVIKTDVPLEAFKVTQGKVKEDAVGEVMGEIESFPPGGAESLSLELPEGNYVLFCNNLEPDAAEGHYQKGMRALLIVEAAQP